MSVGVKLLPSYFFLYRELLFIDLKVDAHNKQLKTVLNMKWHFLLALSDVNIFFMKISFYLFLLDCKIYFYFFFFFLLFAFYESQCLFFQNTFALTFIMKTFEGVKSQKIKKIVFFLPNSNKFAIQNNHSCNCS